MSLIEKLRHQQHRLGIIKKLAVFRLQAQKHGAELRLVQDNLASIDASSTLLFCTLRNEVQRIPFFIDYYRSLGVDHFIFVDNGSTDSFVSSVESHQDVSVFYTEASYKDSNFGMHWLNYLLSKHGTGHWCVVCDPDEFLVYPRCDDRNLRELGTHLQSNGRDSLFSIMIDMYGKNIEAASYRPGDTPWVVCPYFDNYGYSSEKNHYWHNLYVFGGVRLRRFFNKSDHKYPPALNKIPFVKWRWYYAFTSSMHCLAPRRLNDVYANTDVTACLLHFKFFTSIKEKALEELYRKQHYDDSVEYKAYQQAIKEEDTLYDPDYSVTYTGWKQLYDLRLMSGGSWVA